MPLGNRDAVARKLEAIPDFRQKCHFETNSVFVAYCDFLTNPDVWPADEIDESGLLTTVPAFIDSRVEIDLTAKTPDMALAGELETPKGYVYQLCQPLADYAVERAPTIKWQLDPFFPAGFHLKYHQGMSRIFSKASARKIPSVKNPLALHMANMAKLTTQSGISLDIRPVLHESQQTSEILMTYFNPAHREDRLGPLDYKLVFQTKDDWEEYIAGDKHKGLWGDRELSFADDVLRRLVLEICRITKVQDPMVVLKVLQAWAIAPENFEFRFLMHLYGFQNVLQQIAAYALRPMGQAARHAADPSTHKDPKLKALAKTYRSLDKTAFTLQTPDVDVPVAFNLKQLKYDLDKEQAIDSARIMSLYPEEIVKKCGYWWKPTNMLSAGLDVEKRKRALAYAVTASYELVPEPGQDYDSDPEPCKRHGSKPGPSASLRDMFDEGSDGSDGSKKRKASAQKSQSRLGPASTCRSREESQLCDKLRKIAIERSNKKSQRKKDRKKAKKAAKSSSDSSTTSGSRSSSDSD